VLSWAASAIQDSYDTVSGAPNERIAHKGTYWWGISNTLEIEVWPQIGYTPATYLLAPNERTFPELSRNEFVNPDTVNYGAWYDALGALGASVISPIAIGDPGYGIDTPPTMPNGGYLLASDSSSGEELRVYAIVAADVTLTLPGPDIITVNQTTAFAAAGALVVVTSTGTYTVSYTGVTATSFTGCTQGAGVLSTGTEIHQVVDASFDDPAVAYPVYLYDGGVSADLERLFDRLLPAGNWVDLYATERSWPEAR